jgi:hypothetical protein
LRPAISISATAGGAVSIRGIGGSWLNPPEPRISTRLFRLVAQRPTAAPNASTRRNDGKNGPQTYLGILVHEFPNMMMLMGPHTALGNIPRSIEYSVAWVTDLVRFARDNELTRLEATVAGVDSWTDHVKALGVGLLSNEVNSWMAGINSNVEGKQTRIVARYSGSAPAYRARCDEVAAKGYDELALA